MPVTPESLRASLRQAFSWARPFADSPADVQVFRDHVANEPGVAARLADFDVVVAMRERTPFPRALIERLPRLRLLCPLAGQPEGGRP